MYSDLNFFPQVTDEEVNREKSKARQLRTTRWWRNKKGRGVCFYCEKQTSPAELTMDHVVPLIRGGKSTKSNIVAACKECNNKKKYMLPMEWDEYTGNRGGEEDV
ncbi:HNH endonuclease [hydrothermal vent metagenome]|uniref:HNH endonuclease n=1 Tax=hydrothermal vent metagenome TaxID=652676 RepID=A0A3B1D3S8_9ZZZZ